MLTAAQLSTLRRNLEKYEGRTAWMYLDTEGNVTVGVGHLIASAQAAKQLPFVTATGAPATPRQIVDAYRTIKNEPAGFVASYYEPFTSIRLPSAEIDKLTTQHIREFGRELRRIYPEFDRFPVPAKLALFDMIFNLGAGKLQTQFPHMNTDIGNGDWEEAAKHSRRSAPVSAARNAYVHDLFDKAAASV